MKRKFLIITLLLFTLSLLTADENKDVDIGKNSTSKNEEEVILKRKVAVLPFYNASRNPEHDYLSTTISDAIGISLKDTGMYNVIEHSEIDFKIKNGTINTSTFIWEDTAVKVADIFKADVVVFGFYQVVGDEIIINSNALDAEVRKSAINLEESGDSGIMVFETINGISSKLATVMTEKLPAFTKKVRTTTTIGIIGIQSEENDIPTINDLIETIKVSITEDNSWTIIDPEMMSKATRSSEISEIKDISEKDILYIGKESEADILLTGVAEKEGSKIKLILTCYDADNAGVVLSKVVEFSRFQTKKTAGLLSYYILNYENIQKDDETTDYDELSKELSGENKINLVPHKKIDLATRNKVGIAIAVSGGVLAIAGGIILGIDLGWYHATVEKTLYEEDTYEAYYNRYITDKVMLGAGIGSLSIGSIMLVTGIILAVIPVKKGVTLALTGGLDHMSIGFAIEL